MEIKNAVRTAIDSVQDLFQAENLTNLGLEEINFDDASDEWVITVGFSRPWNYREVGMLGTTIASAVIGAQVAHPERDFKLVRVRDSDGHIMSVKNWR